MQIFVKRIMDLKQKGFGFFILFSPIIIAKQSGIYPKI